MVTSRDMRGIYIYIYIYIYICMRICRNMQGYIKGNVQMFVDDARVYRDI